jgi:hypothetical protein
MTMTDARNHCWLTGKPLATIKKLEPTGVSNDISKPEKVQSNFKLERSSTEQDLDKGSVTPTSKRLRNTKSVQDASMMSVQENSLASMANEEKPKSSRKRSREETGQALPAREMILQGKKRKSDTSLQRENDDNDGTDKQPRRARVTRSESRMSVSTDTGREKSSTRPSGLERK